MPKFKFEGKDAEQVKDALMNLKNDTLSELSAEFVTGGGCPCTCSWSKTKFSKIGLEEIQ